MANAVGNTPTYVGKTSRFGRTFSAGRKHPHVRGEDLSVISQMSLS